MYRTGTQSDPGFPVNFALTPAESAVSLPYVLSLRSGAHLAQTAEGGLVLHWQERCAPLGTPPAGVRDAMLRIEAASDHVDALFARVVESDGFAAIAWLHALLDQLAQWRLLLRSVHDTHGPIATLVPISRGFCYPDHPIRADRRYQLSRFCHLRRAGSDITLESPLSHGRVLVVDPRAMLPIHALAQPCALAQLTDMVPALPPHVLHALLGLLHNAALTCETDETGASSETSDPDLCAWEFHDLLFHARSRQGRHDGAAGATYLGGKLGPPPAIKPAMASEGIDLAVPELGDFHGDDVSFEAVVAARRSVRDYGRVPISRAQLGEFLYRVGRVIAKRSIDLGEPVVALETTQRPYPSAGALHELEFYIAVARAEDLAAGFYHYHPERHRLERLDTAPADLAALLAEAGHGTMIPRENLQVLIILSARFRRMTWKYSSMAYAAILKNVGVVYQTMYLVATAMDLAPCAIGSGDSDRFARLIGTAMHVESSVGEFLLGSRAETARGGQP
jgi:SagB-type dehydrogenase family enzyme